MYNRNRIKVLSEGGIMIALSLLLNQIKIYQAPNGGSVTAGSMIPIILFALKWGVKPGIAVGSVYGILDFIFKPYFFHWGQFLLDYPIAYGLLGLAGIGHITTDEGLRDYIRLIGGILFAIFSRMIAHVLSGVIFFSEAAGTENPWIYSIGYNMSYLVPELIISIVVLVLIWKPLKRVVFNESIK
ncbi:MAG TPA: energy-coupled thiamine transporter ThiT [Tissierellaceae bacterium]|nr:energy-coupled thiamine transporter ThiT [Tissierellaceae bacterium]